jgi:hypothetical protein
MLNAVLLWGAVAGVIHFVVIGALYGNPVIDKMYADAAGRSPAVRQWPSKARYLVTQFLGTQVEVYILTFAFFWLRPHVATAGVAGALWVGLLLAAVRVYPRFWNMWIQTTYPRPLLAVEAVNGTIGTIAIAIALQLLART